MSDNNNGFFDSLANDKSVLKLLEEAREREKQQAPNAIIKALKQKLEQQEKITKTNAYDYKADTATSLADKTRTHVKRVFSKKIGEEIDNDEPITLNRLKELYSDAQRSVIEYLNTQKDQKEAAIDILNTSVNDQYEKQILRQQIECAFPNIPDEKKQRQINAINKTPQPSSAQLVEIYILTLIKKGRLKQDSLPNVPVQPKRIKNNLLDSINPTLATNNIEDAVMDVCNSNTYKQQSYMDPNDLKSQRHYQPNSLNTLVKNVLYNISTDRDRLHLESKLFRLVDPGEKNIIFSEEKLSELREKQKEVYKKIKNINTANRILKQQQSNYLLNNINEGISLYDKEIQNEIKRANARKQKKQNKNLINSNKRQRSPIKNGSDGNLYATAKFKISKK